MGIVIPVVLILLACLVIWRACDGFEIASEYLGRNLSEGVRGGTINAISSSIPELLTTVIALLALADEEGFAVGLGTTAGSALFNGMIIPAACILAVVGTIVAGQRVTAVNVSGKVILRDGLTLLVCEMVVIWLISGQLLQWWKGLILLLLYVAYFTYMLRSMKTGRDDAACFELEPGGSGANDSAFGRLFYWLTGGPLLDLEGQFIREPQRRKIADETWNAWPLLLVSTLWIAAACWVLVHACSWLGSGAGNAENPSYTLFGSEFEGIGMPSIFVAVIFASMATSVPDTVMSIRDARDGDYDDAVANALGSNIFDLCFALGLPILVYTLFFGPIEMPADVAHQSGEILLLLLALTAAGFLIYYIGPRGVGSGGAVYVSMGRGTAVLLILLYVFFVTYVVGRSQGAVWAESLAELLQQVVASLPRPT